MYNDTKAEVLPEALPKEPYHSDFPEQEALRLAAARIEKHGWVQAKYGCPPEGYCMVGAIGVPDHYDRTIWHLATSLGWKGYWEGSQVCPETYCTRYNDQRVKSKAEAMFLLLKAAEEFKPPAWRK